METIFITVTTHNERYFSNLQLSAKLNDVELVVLGLGLKWKGFGQKLKLIFNYVYENMGQGNIDPDTLICVVDGFDTMLTPNVKLIQDTFYEISKHSQVKNKFFLGLNAQSWTNHIDKYLFGTGNNNKFINGGCWIATARALIDVLKYIDCEPDNLDDQVYFTKLHRSKVVGDDDRKIFHYMRTPYDCDFDKCSVVSYICFGDMSAMSRTLGLPSIHIQSREKVRYLRRTCCPMICQFICGIGREMKNFILDGFNRN